MFRSRTPRAVVAALTAVVLIVGLMASTTSAAPPPGKGKPTPTPTGTPTPTPTPTSANRIVYFGDDTGDGVFVPSIVTAGNVFEFTLIARNDGNANLTHASIGYGSLAVAREGSPSLPAGMSIASATLDGVNCTLADGGAGALCDVDVLTSGETVTAQFIVNAPSVAPLRATYASFKVAEAVPDQGANRNTFYADGTVEVGVTNSNGVGTFKRADEALSLSTGDQALVKKDSMTTTVSAPGVNGGAISISEVDCTTDDPCKAGQIATVHVRDGDAVDLVWTLVIVGKLPSPLVITHELDGGGEPVLIQDSCSVVLTTNCIDDVTKNGNVSTIIFKTPTNGRIRV